MNDVSMIRRTKMQKRKAAIARAAINIAKQKNDPLYKRYVRCRNLWLEFKREMTKKYEAQAKAQVMRGMS